jgi:hypothetical protein
MYEFLDIYVFIIFVGITNVKIGIVVFSGMTHVVVWQVRANVPEKHTASIIEV